MVKLFVVCILLVVFAVATGIQNEQSDEHRQYNVSVKAICLLTISTLSMGIVINLVSDDVEYLINNPPSIRIPVGSWLAAVSEFAQNIEKQFETLLI